MPDEPSGGTRMVSTVSDVVEVYKAYINDANQLQERKQAIANSYLTLVTLFLAGVALVTQSAVTAPRTPFGLDDMRIAAWAPEVIIFVIGLLGARLCVNWAKQIRSISDTLKLKYRKIVDLETTSPLSAAGADLYTKEDERYPAPTPENKDAPRHETSLIVEGQAGFFQVLFLALAFAAILIKAAVIVAYLTLPASILRVLP